MRLMQRCEFGLNFHDVVYAGSEGSGETAHNNAEARLSRRCSPVSLVPKIQCTN